MSNKHDGTTIIRRQSRQEDHAHGGAWKVAFADFTLALMSLFMVLWVMSVATPKERERIAAEVTRSAVFEGGVGIFRQHSKTPPVIENPPIPQFGKASSIDQDGRSETATPPVPDSLRALEAAVRASAAELGLLSNIETVIERDRLKITVHDSKDRGMFVRGSDVLDAHIAELFRALAPALAKSADNLVIAGHTDSVRYANASTFENNWNLSSRRAQRVRETLETGGLADEQVFQVAAMGNRVPAVPDDPTDARNRRVDLLVLTPHALAQWKDQMNAGGPDGASAPAAALPPASGSAAAVGEGVGAAAGAASRPAANAAAASAVIAAVNSTAALAAAPALNSTTSLVVTSVAASATGASAAASAASPATASMTSPAVDSSAASAAVPAARSVVASVASAATAPASAPAVARRAPRP